MSILVVPLVEVDIEDDYGAGCESGEDEAAWMFLFDFRLSVAHRWFCANATESTPLSAD